MESHSNVFSIYISDRGMFLLMNLYFLLDKFIHFENQMFQRLLRKSYEFTLPFNKYKKGGMYLFEFCLFSLQ
jgi:hypothetical protein